MGSLVKVILLTVLVASLAVTSSSMAIPNLKAAEKHSTTLTCGVSPQEVHLGLRVTVYGDIIPFIEVPVTLTFIRPDGTSFQRSTWTHITSGGARYYYYFTPDMEGVWRVYASWPGNDNYYGDTTDMVNFTVLPPITITKIYVTLSKREVTVGDTLEVSGRLVAIVNDSEVPIGGVPIILRFDNPVRFSSYTSTFTEDDGTFSVIYKPAVVGEWRVIASWEGNETFASCSEDELFTVLERKFPLAEVVCGTVAVIVVVLVVIFLRRRGGS